MGFFSPRGWLSAFVSRLSPRRARQVDVGGRVDAANVVEVLRSLAEGIIQLAHQPHGTLLRLQRRDQRVDLSGAVL